ncbi:MAG: hypothetical protein WC683_14050 [bacterium]
MTWERITPTHYKQAADGFTIEVIRAPIGWQWYIWRGPQSKQLLIASNRDADDTDSALGRHKLYYNTHRAAKRAAQSALTALIHTVGQDDGSSDTTQN